MVNNPYIIVQARMNSVRLPSKVMMEIGGKPLIGILLERLSESGTPIILATSTNPENDILADYVQSMGVEVFRGSEDNVLKRFYEAAKSVNADVIIRATGDNPLLDGVFLKENLEKYQELKDERAYLSTAISQSYPLGMSVEIFSFSLLKEACQNSTHPGEFEHVTPYMHNKRAEDIKILKPKRNESKYHYRLTVDTPEDFLLNKKLIEEFGCDKRSLEEIIEILDNNPQFLSINCKSIQKKWDQ